MITLDDHFMLHYRLGKEYLESGTKRYMRTEYERAYQLNPNHPMICKNYAVVCLEEKRYEEGLEAITKAEGSENELVILVKAILLQKLKRYDEAFEAAQNALKKVDKFFKRQNKEYLYCIMGQVLKEERGVETAVRGISEMCDDRAIYRKVKKVLENDRVRCMKIVHIGDDSYAGRR